MKKIINYLLAFGFILSFVLACKKEKRDNDLPTGSVGIHKSLNKDTVEIPLSILKDSAVVINIKAERLDHGSNAGHWVKFSVDTTRMLEYRSRYGEAKLLPYNSYIMMKTSAFLPDGEKLSNSIPLNITLQTKLSEYTTYVLPVIVESVDGSTDAANNQVLYFVFKTGRPLFINRAGFTIHSFSSQTTALAANILDDNQLTYWGTIASQTMPQWVVVNLNRDVVFSAVNYTFPVRMSYPTLGGYPTSIKIETSMNGTTWTDKGTFEGKLVNNSQTVDIGLTTARYVKFSSLASVKFGGSLTVIYISELTLMP